MVMIQSVIAQAVASRMFQINNDLNSSIINLVSGHKENAGVADFSIGTMLSTQSSTLKIATINAGQGKSLMQTAKSALGQIIELLGDQKDLAIQAADSSLTDNERASLNTQFAAITTEINRLATTTKFNNKLLLDGSISGNAGLTSVTGQATENYSLLSTSDFSMSGTVAAGELVTSSTFNTVATNSTGKTAGSSTLSFAVGGATTNAVVTLTGGATITFGSGQATAAGVATAFVAAAEASTNNTVRRFTYKDNGDGTVTVKAADLGTGAANIINTTAFSLTNRGGGITANATTFGGDNIDTIGAGTAESFTSSAGSTLGTNKSVTTATLDAKLEGGFSNFAAALDTSNTQNEVTFTVEINGTTYTSQAVTLFGTGGFNSKGNTIRNGQVIVFTNTAGPTDSNGVVTDNAFSLTVGATDITIAGGTQDAFETDLNNTATGFETQLATNQINQSRDVILDETNPTGSDFTISAATGTTFAGIKGFDAIGSNTKGDILFVGSTFGDDGRLGSIGSFSFNSSVNKISVDINGETYTADISDSTANTGGIVNGAGSYNSTTKVITAGAGTILVFHSASTTDGKQLRIDLSNLTDNSIDLGTDALSEAFTDDLDTLFGVSENPSLSFQVGASGSDTIGITLGSAKTTDIYLDNAGTSKTLDISTLEGATAASDVLDNAINNVLSLVATTSAGISSFTSAIVGNNVMTQNFDAASSVLLDTDYAEESTLYAEAALKLSSGAAVLAQEQRRLENILKLLQF